MRLIILSFILLIRLPAEAQKLPVISISEIATTKADTFRIRALIKEIYVCPTCPKGAICKPCIGDHVMVSGNQPHSDLLRIFTKNPNVLKIGKRYLFTLVHHNKAHPESGTNLIAYEL